MIERIENAGYQVPLVTVDLGITGISCAGLARGIVMRRKGRIAGRQVVLLNAVAAAFYWLGYLPWALLSGWLFGS